MILLYMSEELPGSNIVIEARPPADAENIPWVDLTPLSPTEALDLYRYAQGDNSPPSLLEEMDNVYSHISQLNPQRAEELFSVGAQSRDPKERALFASRQWLYELIKVDHDAGLALLDRVIRDGDIQVVEAAHNKLLSLLVEAVPMRPNKWFSDPSLQDFSKHLRNLPEPYLMEVVDNDRLRAITGLNLQEADDLLVASSDARRDKGTYNPGKEALIRVQAHRLSAGYTRHAAQAGH